MSHRLSCHCGAIRLEVDADLGEVVECNCSTCSRSGFLHWKVPSSAVHLLTEGVRLTTYAWRSATEGHSFCPTCGTPLLRTGYPQDRVSVNARALDGVDVFTLRVRRFDGRHEMPPGPR